jgi:hypothetical protein
MLRFENYEGLFRGRNIIWQNRWGYACLGMDRLCPIQVVLCVDDSRTQDAIEERTNIRFLCLDTKSGRRIVEAPFDAIVPTFRAEIMELLAQDPKKTWSFVCPAVSQSLVSFAAELGCEFFCPSPDLGHWLNDKANFLAALDTLGLPRLRGRWTCLRASSYAELSSEMGSGFVAQIARGTAGSGTAFICSEQDYSTACSRLGEKPAWIAPDLGLLSLNINALATEGGIAVAYPSVQLDGLRMLGCRRGMYCGNDYAATADLGFNTWAPVVEHTERIGRWLLSLGFRGLYGLDFVLDSSSGLAYAVDLNPRWQGSTVLLTQAECKAGRLPLAIAEMAYRMGILEAAEIVRHRDGFLEPIAASHMCLRSRLTGWSEVRGDLLNGIYSLAPGEGFRRCALYLEELEPRPEILVNGAVPRRGALMGPGASVVRASAERALMDVSAMKPFQWSESAARMLYSLLELTPVEDA